MPGHFFLRDVIAEDKGSALGDAIQQVEELREADGSGVGALDERVAGGAESCDAKGHCDAVIAAGVDGGAMEGLSARNIEAVIKFLDFSAHGAKVLGDEGDAVGLFDAELARAADADAAAGEGRDSGEDGQFVNELRGESAADFR